MEDDYTWGELLTVTRQFWTIREKGNGSSFASARMLDVSRAYAILTTSEKCSLFNGVWLEREPVPAAVIAKMKMFLNSGSAA